MSDRVGQQLGNYRLIHLLGKGGFAEVYLGEHTHLNTKAAIKILHTQLSQNEMEKFRNEARIIAQLDHPHIVPILDFGIDDAIPYLIMKYAPNGTLRHRHPRGTNLPPSIVVSYAKQIADALHYIHAQRLVHRDIKPENLLVGNNNEILVSDFGIAVVTQSSLYQSTKDMAGTIAYMAPEQIESHPRPASDQYALGIVVYEWLTGDLPFHGSFTEVAVKHSLVPPPPMHVKAPNVPLLLERAVLKALAKDPKQRFATVQAFAHALEQASQASFYNISPPKQTSQPSSTPPVQNQLPQIKDASTLPKEPVSLDKPIVQAGPPLSHIQAVPQIQQPDKPAVRFIPANQVPIQNIPEQVRQLAASSQLGAPLAEYRVRPRIVKLNGYFLLFGLLLLIVSIELVRISSWLNILFWGTFSVLCIFIGLDLSRLTRALMQRSRRVFVHVHGIIQVNGSKIDVFRWNEIVAFWDAVSEHFFFGFQTGTSHSCAVLLTNGKDYRFSEAFLNIEELSNTINRQATRYLVPKAINAYYAGTPVSFGNLSVSQQGISNGKLALAWNQIEDFEVFQDAITVKTTTNRGRKTRVLSLKVQSLPNVPVFEALVNHVFAHRATAQGKASP